MFTFQGWAPTAEIGEPNTIAAAFTGVYDAFWADSTTCPDLTFEIVDLRPGSYTSGMVETLIDTLAGLLLADTALCRNFSRESRLLFIGGVRTLATREKEINARAIKQDAEFYIRALQNYDVAHYAGIGAGEIASASVDLSIRSALIGMLRHYRDASRRLPYVQLAERLSQIRSDIEDLTKTARELFEFNYLGSADNPRFDGNRVDYHGLLLEIGLIYQFGKGERPNNFSPNTVLAALRWQGRLTFDAVIEHSSYELFIGMLAKMGEWARAFHAAAVSDADGTPGLDAERFAIADELAKRSFKLARYELLRDFGRVLGQGSLQRFRELGPVQPLLLIDDEFHAILAETPLHGRSEAQTPNQLIRRLEVALASAGQAPHSVHVVSSAYIDVNFGLMQADSPSGLIAEPGRMAAYDLSGQQIALGAALHKYVAVLIDPESRRDSCGPVRVQRLRAFLENHLGAGPDGPRADATSRLLPPILAFSRKESSGYVQQCLNMGASAFIPKMRPYQLLFGLSRALRDERRKSLSDGHASQFRILKTLKPHAASKLLRKSGPSYVYGGIALANGSHLEDPHEVRWIANLPKADLHYHFGTAIPLEMVSLLAMNTAGHFLAGAADSAGHDNRDRGANPLLHRLATTLALTARLERLFVPLSSGATFSRMELLAAAADAVQPGKALDNHAFGLGDAIIRHLVESNDRCDDAHATALLVAMMASQDNFIVDDAVRAYFDTLAARAGQDECGASPAAFSAEAALDLEIRRAYLQFNRVACSWNGSCTGDDFKLLARVDAIGFWCDLRDQFYDRVTRANQRLRGCLDRALSSVEVEAGDDSWRRACDWLKRHNPSLFRVQRREPDTPLTGKFALADYVSAPEVATGRGLQLYLRGADLLGSSHLQYPENLWLAALAITLDNAEQNVVYSEIRCETTGYAKAGMGARDATELLRHGFNLASLYVARLTKLNTTSQRRPLVRTNILLAAKRHKTEGEAGEVVQLLNTYLEQRAPAADAAQSRRFYFERFGETMPAWWRPCDVVGFDLSGDESRDEPWLKTVIMPLAARSSPVTIHAGEAASAESIWRAVYELNALRIGHGLRLSEDTALLGYCVREGICMELCPNSNRYTNHMTPHQRRDLDGASSVSPLRYEYPLLHYLSQGMEVTLGTDNRYLHREGQHTLTSEYLTAAELVGGLTRWEILQIVKAGFKNAFLDKTEVRAIIEAVESEIYRIVATDFI